MAAPRSVPQVSFAGLFFLTWELDLGKMHELVEKAVQEAYQKREEFIRPANKLGFILAKNLQEIYPKSVDPFTFEPLVEEYLAELQRLHIDDDRETDELSVDDLMEQLDDAWLKVDKSASRLQQVIDNLDEWIDEPVVAQVKSIKTRKILAVCYGLQELAGEKPFFLTQKAAGEIVNIKQAAAGVKMNFLVRKNILTIVEKGHTGFGTSYLLREHPFFLKTMCV